MGCYIFVVGNQLAKLNEAKTGIFQPTANSRCDSYFGYKEDIMASLVWLFKRVLH